MAYMEKTRTGTCVFAGADGKVPKGIDPITRFNKLADEDFAAGRKGR